MKSQNKKDAIKKVVEVTDISEEELKETVSSYNFEAKKIPSSGVIIIDEPKNSPNKFQTKSKKAEDQKEAGLYFFVPDLGEIILNNIGQIEVNNNITNRKGQIFDKHSVGRKYKEKAPIKKKPHQLSKVINTRYPYFTHFPPFDKPFYKPMNSNPKPKKMHIKSIHRRRKPLSIFTKIVSTISTLIRPRNYYRYVAKKRLPIRKQTKIHEGRRKLSKGRETETHKEQNKLQLRNLQSQNKLPIRKEIKPHNVQMKLSVRKETKSHQKLSKHNNVQHKSDTKKVPIFKTINNRNHHHEYTPSNSLPFLHIHPPQITRIAPKHPEYLLVHILLISIPLLFAGKALSLGDS